MEMGKYWWWLDHSKSEIHLYEITLTFSTCLWRVMGQESLLMAGRPVGVSIQLDPSCLLNSAFKYGASRPPLFIRSPPPLSSTTYSLTWHIRMSGSVVADIRDTYGIAFIGLLISAVCVLSLCLLISLLILPTHSLYGITLTQTWVTHPPKLLTYHWKLGHPDGFTTGNQSSFFHIATQHWTAIANIVREIRWCSKDSSPFYCTWDIGSTIKRLRDNGFFSVMDTLHTILCVYSLYWWDKIYPCSPRCSSYQVSNPKLRQYRQPWSRHVVGRLILPGDLPLIRSLGR
jgi:hypothetical protein